MSTIIYDLALKNTVRIYIAAAPAIILFFLATTNVYATQVTINPSTGDSYRQADFGIPAIIIAAAAVVGALLLVGERKKAKGIWFSNSEKLR